MKLDPLQQARRAHRELRVGFLDRLFPDFVFPLIRSPAHPVRFCGRSIPGVPSFASEPKVQHCGSSLEATERVLSLARITEAIGLPAPEMPAAVRQIQLSRAAACLRA